MKVYEVLNILDEWAPFETAEEFDNVGLLVGDADDEVSGILIALDLTIDVIEEAKDIGANLIVTHHPVIFDPMTDMTPETSQGRVVRLLVKSAISVISAHTNLDMADGGVSDTLAEALELDEIKRVEQSAFMRVGKLEKDMSPQEFSKYVSQKLGTKRIMSAGPAPQKISTVCVMGGSGGGFINEAKSVGADVFLTGSVKHEQAVAAQNLGFYMMAAGHYETENIVLSKICACLQKHADDVQSIDTINITKSGKNPFDIMV